MRAWPSLARTLYRYGAFLAREATLEERERLWPFLASQYGGYQVYQERTDRLIPVVILEQR